MDRRRFLVASAAVLGSTTVLARTEPAQKQMKYKSPHVRKALKISMIQQGESLTEKFSIALQAGFEGVELDSPNSLDPSEVMAAKASTGIEIPGVVNSIHWQEPLSHPELSVRESGRRGLAQAISDCKAYGGTTVLLVPAVVNEHVSYREAYDRSQQEIAKVLPFAQDLGIQIAIENVWNNFLLSPIEAARYVDELNAHVGDHPPVVGWYFDVGNIWASAWPRHWLDELGPERVLTLDIKGFSRAKADKEGRWAGFRVGIGDDDVPWDTVRQWISDHHWRGWATAEVAGGDLAHLTDIARRLESVLGLS